jgi:hypothetical protein
MLNKLKAIADGWIKYAFENPLTEAIAIERANVCAGCEHSEMGFVAFIIDYKHEQQAGMVCNICNCPLSRKTRSKNETCPKDKWKC